MDFLAVLVLLYASSALSGRAAASSCTSVIVGRADGDRNECRWVETQVVENMLIDCEGRRLSDQERVAVGLRFRHRLGAEPMLPGRSSTITRLLPFD